MEEFGLRWVRVSCYFSVKFENHPEPVGILNEYFTYLFSFHSFLKFGFILNWLVRNLLKGTWERKYVGAPHPFTKAALGTRDRPGASCWRCRAGWRECTVVQPPLLWAGVWWGTQTAVTQPRCWLDDFTLSLWRKGAYFYDAIYPRGLTQNSGGIDFSSRTHQDFMDEWEFLELERIFQAKKNKQHQPTCSGMNGAHSVQRVIHCWYLGSRLFLDTIIHLLGTFIIGKEDRRWWEGDWKQERGRSRKYVCSGLRNGTPAACYSQCPWQTLPINYRTIVYWVQKPQPRNL